MQEICYGRKNCAPYPDRRGPDRHGRADGRCPGNRHSWLQRQHHRRLGRVDSLRRPDLRRQRQSLGTTSAGGASTAITTDGEGTVFELTPTAGGGWTEKVLYSFGATATDGIAPYAGLVFDAKGNLYGTTSLGGANGLGTAFELTPGTGGVWTERVLYSFGATSTDASQPKRGSLIFNAKGNIYGTTNKGEEDGARKVCFILLRSTRSS